MNTLLTIALPQETGGLFDGIPVVYTGVGKVNASVALTEAIMNSRPEQVINMGSAASPSLQVGDVVCCTKFIQRDMNATPLGLPLYHTPFDSFGILENGLLVKGFEDKVCGLVTSLSH